MEIKPSFIDSMSVADRAAFTGRPGRLHFV